MLTLKILQEFRIIYHVHNNVSMKHKHSAKQGRIHGNPVAEGWAGAKNRSEFKDVTDRSPDLPTDTARCRIPCPRLKMTYYILHSQPHTLPVTHQIMHP